MNQLVVPRLVYDVRVRRPWFTGRLVFDTTKPDGTPRKLMDVSLLKALGWQATVWLEEGLGYAYRWFIDNQQRFRG